MSILVVGSLHLDVVLRAPHLPAIDETVTGSAVDYVFGGKGGNQAVAAARMGAKVQLAGRTGSDAFGQMIRDTLQRSGLDLAQLQSDAGASGMSAAIVDAQGDYGAVIVSAANLNIEAGKLFVPEGTQLVLLQNEIPEAINVDVARKAGQAGAKVWLNAAPARALPDALLELVDLLIVNRVEAAFYEGERFLPDMLVTQGADGVCYRGRHHAAHAVDVISTHGAGDMFVGALAAAYVAGGGMEAAIGFAQGAAALHVSAGAEKRQTLDAAQVRDFLAAQSSR
jgi:ribokinase